MGEDDVGSGEVDDRVDVAEFFFGERGAGGIFLGAGDASVMFTLGGDFRNQRARFAAA
jgi:hypothetical protein